MKLILASRSPRRAEILRSAGFAFDVRAAGVDETRQSSESPSTYVVRLARAKARATATELAQPASEPCFVLGADTVVAANGELLGKPGTPAEAERMLKRLSGVLHEVHTGISVIRLPDGAERSTDEVTRVVFSRLSPVEIADYVATGEPLDKAGAYGIQGIGGRFVERIEGCYFNVMGLPLSRLYRILRELGWEQAGFKGL